LIKERKELKIVFLDAEAIGEDIDLSAFSDLGEFISYPNSTLTEAAERVRDADIILSNKALMNEETLKDAKKVRLICVTATGINNLDLPYLKERGIEWRNAAGYSTDSVAQHTFALLFYLMEHLRYYDEYVKSGAYINCSSFTNIEKPFPEIAGKTWGILGLGAIGRRVAQIAEAFGAEVIYASASGGPPQDGYRQVSVGELYERSDILSVHAPLNEHTEGIINKEAFARMKDTCIFLNLGRGPIVVEKDLAEAIDTHQIAAAGIDVLCHEPMEEGNPLLSVKEADRLLVTPHIAWAAKEARERLMDITLEHVKEFISNC